MYRQISTKPGFIAALDQSGGSTPGALRAYGISDSAWHADEAEMFGLMHEMRVRTMSSQSFTGAKVIAAILFERTMDAEASRCPASMPSQARRQARYLWHQDALGDQACIEARHRRDRRTAVRSCGPDLGARSDAHHQPEILIKSPDKAGCEALLRDALLGRLDALPRGAQVTESPLKWSFISLSVSPRPSSWLGVVPSG
jgi:fructose-bisphosphate aldolase class I